MVKKRAFCLTAWLLALPFTATANPPSAPSKPLATALDALEQRCPALQPVPDGEARETLATFYQRRDFEPAWRSYRQIDRLLEALETLADDGLAPASYAPQRIRELTQSASREPLHRACADLAASHAYLQALDHLAYGRLAQAAIEPLWRSPDSPAQRDRHQLLARAWDGLDDPRRAFDSARPQLALYRQLREIYAALRRAPLPAWQPIPAGASLHPDDRDPRVPLLRQRLGAPDAAQAERYDAALVAAVRDFQLHHGIEEDGVVGRATLAALNVSPASRLDQLRINLERLRWFAGEVEPRSLLVDIAGASLSYFEDGELRWRTRTQVGREARRTPPLKSRVTRLTLNPTWTVPPTILREDKLPQIRQDPNYLAHNRMSVLDRQGNRLDPATVDWDNPGSLMLRQDAGPENPLGRVAVRFANPFSVYLHDTPSQALFERAGRTTSSGCVRVQGAMQLVDLLLTDAERPRVTQLLDSGQTHEYRLARSIPILMAYWTAAVDESGRLFYHPDIYHQDARLLEALNAAERGQP
ncbi:L,D-transpeptidase family protein [Pseudomonas oligotrophica]|uniref:L,D-transpeptidase family protein n=1 Tax=Pseudomonas oligotrophica TaxID=2912055 RepID=UPI001F0194AB|nr:L,D-transpeptidase family protein [Pseudomonas oligotrophica]MCF7200910.1 L,D-transpeptidase family protein [Pseudomonas oligotrophica]